MDAWDKFEILLETYAYDEKIILECFARYMSSDMLDDYCETFAREHDIDFEEDFE